MLHNNDKNPFSEEHFGIDLKVVALFLKIDLKNLPPPFHVENPLDETDFTDNEFTNSFIVDLKDVSNIIKTGFLNPKADLTCLQWLCATSQLLATVLHGMGTYVPGDNFPSILSHLKHEEGKALNNIGKAVEALRCFFTDPPSPNSQHWQQCLRCLQLSGNTISAKDFTAQLLTCNQHADAACTSLLNSFTGRYQMELLTYRDAQRTTAYDQAMLRVISEHPPPFEADPHVIE
jgi:hypothetical protein